VTTAIKPGWRLTSSAGIRILPCPWHGVDSFLEATVAGHFPLLGIIGGLMEMIGAWLGTWRKQVRGRAEGFRNLYQSTVPRNININVNDIVIL
jgi:hypothetical protein